MTTETAIREALAAGPTAWRYRYRPDGDWHLAESPAGPEWLAEHAPPRFEQQPLINITPDDLTSLLSDLDTLRQRAEKAEEDARRYRWLRDTAPALHKATPLVVHCDIDGNPIGSAMCLRSLRLDEAVDEHLSARAAIGGTP